MNFFVADDQPLRRGEVLSAFRSALASVLGRQVKTQDAQFLDSQLADFMAWDATGRVYAVRWVDGREIATKLFDLLSQYARLSEAGSAALSRALRTGDVQMDGNIELVLVGNRFSDRFVDVLSTLAIPVRLVSVHSVSSGAKEEKALYFETRFVNSYAAASAVDGPSESEAWEADRNESIEAVPDATPVAVRPLALDGQRPGGAEVLPAQKAKISSIAVVSEDDGYEDLIAPASDEDAPDGFGGLSPEESTHFRLLEAALRPRDT